MFSNLNGHLSTLLDEALFANYISCCPILIGNQSQRDRFQWKGRFLPQSQATDVLHSTTLLQQLYIKSTTILNPTQQVYIISPSILLLYNDSKITAIAKLLRNNHLYFSQTGECYIQCAWQSWFQPLLQWRNGGTKICPSVSCLHFMKSQHFYKMVNWTCTSWIDSRYLPIPVPGIAVGILEISLLECLN